ncbi:hypothetical protein BS50DRAFT_123122 [Corynespora cassiicola Philippines]|uniref:Uncharacterized protein n=1 Tax=Corynespora cassiicola Philippines TaxID=1448308 RepID=A0A2T2NAY5_CORCC|nr:hypothetical protein BS50DRAFT_123122 [Corynespora cassiicola Philippines]
MMAYEALWASGGAALSRRGRARGMDAAEGGNGRRACMARCSIAPWPMIEGDCAGGCGQDIFDQIMWSMYAARVAQSSPEGGPRSGRQPAPARERRVAPGVDRTDATDRLSFHLHRASSSLCDLSLLNPPACPAAWPPLPVCPSALPPCRPLVCPHSPLTYRCYCTPRPSTETLLLTPPPPIPVIGLPAPSFRIAARNHAPS